MKKKNKVKQVKAPFYMPSSPPSKTIKSRQNNLDISYYGDGEYKLSDLFEKRGIDMSCAYIDIIGEYDGATVSIFNLVEEPNEWYDEQLLKHKEWLEQNKIVKQKQEQDKIKSLKAQIEHSQKELAKLEAKLRKESKAK